MPKRIKEDHRHFRDVIEGRTRKELGRLIKTANIVGMRPNKDGKMAIPIKQIDHSRVWFKLRRSKESAVA